MDGSLDLDVLRNALGPSPRLPSAEDLAAMISNSELQLLGVAGEIPDELVETGWYLHAVASSWNAEDEYPFERRRHAFAVSAHIFDLTLQSREFERDDQLRLMFAAQIGFARSSLDPNAIAVRRRTERRHAIPLLENPGIALDAGSALLAGDAAWLYEDLRRYGDEAAAIEADWGIPLRNTVFGSAIYVLDGVRRLLQFTTRGTRRRLEEANGAFRDAINNASSEADIDSRWVAAHLLNYGTELAATSIWSALPPDVPDGVRRAFSMAAPPIMTLWPPQVDALRDRDGRSIASPATRRVVMSMPTSAGKTSLAQILAVAHLSTQDTGVCFIAPTKALCREIERSIRSRMRYMRRETVIDFGDDAFATIDLTDAPDIAVMTPEALASVVRRDLNAFVEKYGLIVFDEVHNVADASRGWTLEGLISLIHAATLDTTNRIVLMSAALGNRVHFSSWIDPDGQGIEVHFDWRGPRRLTAIYTADAAAFETAAELPARPNSTARRWSRPLTGALRVMAPGGDVVRLALTDPVGTLVTRFDRGEWSKDQASTPFYQTLVPLIHVLRRSGPVLVVAPTKPMAMDLARAIAEESAAADPGRAIYSLIDRRLGSDHPLTVAAGKGIAYHHGSLSRDIQAAIEEAIGDGSLDVVVATTTLTEGVNLPVRSVLVAAQGSWGAQGFTEYITGATLLNAIGRAGRAARETEGWVVLGRQAAYDAADFDRLEPDEAELASISTLAASSGLQELEALEEADREGVDVAFENYGDTVDGFMSFVWFICRGDEDRAEQFVRSTLGWQQLGPDLRDRWLEVSRTVARAYHRTERGARRRWAQSGLSLASARLLDELANEVASEATDEEPASVGEALTLLLGGQRLTRLFTMQEAPATQFRRYRTAPRDVNVDIEAMLRRWIDGQSISDIADTSMGAVANRQFRLEQVGDFVAGAFETFLPWSIGLMADWAIQANPALEAETFRFVPAAIRYGVNSKEAARMLRRGLPSRTLAVAVADSFERAETELDLRGWLAQTDPAEWMQQFDAAISDVRDLLEYARRPGAGLLASLIDGEEVVVPIDLTQTIPEAVTLQRLELSVDPVPRVRLHATEGYLGSVRPQDHADFATLIATAIPVRGTVEPTAEGAQLRVAIDLPGA